MGEDMESPCECECYDLSENDCEYCQERHREWELDRLEEEISDLLNKYIKLGGSLCSIDKIRCFVWSHKSN